MNYETFDRIPESRIDFERIMNIVLELNIDGRLNIVEGLGSHGLDLVRKLPNGRFDLQTINEGARSIANMVANKHQMEK